MMFLSQDHSTSEQANSPDRPHAVSSATLRAVQCRVVRAGHRVALGLTFLLCAACQVTSPTWKHGCEALEKRMWDQGSSVPCVLFFP